KTVSSTETVGPRLTASAPTADGSYVARFGDFDIPGLANPINGAHAYLEGLTLDGPRPELGQRFCGGLAGKLVVPLEYTYNRTENPCLFLPVAEGDHFPTVKSSDFHCP